MKKLTGRLVLAALCIWLLPRTALAAQLLVPVGQIVGLELGGDSVTVAAFDDVHGLKARAAGLQIGDEICEIDGIPITSAQDVHRALERSDGTVELRLERGDEVLSVNVSPEITENGPRLGVYLRQGITGIGTVTFYDPETGRFGTLGHGVNDSAGKLAEMGKGNAYRARVLSVKKGKAGEPGQLRGAVEEALGTLTGNTARGVFGTTESGWLGEAIPVAAAAEITTGPAVIRSTVSGNQVREYSVEILKIYPQTKSDGRNFLLKVTDPELLAITGGIVQGMSGSPILQNGKIVGAVTHVLVQDATTGYGIYIGNMLEAAA